MERLSKDGGNPKGGGRVRSAKGERSSKWKFEDFQPLKIVDGYWKEDLTDQNWQQIPEKMLCFSMLENAIRDLAFRDEYKKALNWLFDTTMEEFSFLWVCETLDTDPEAIRAMAVRYYKQNKHKLQIH